MPALIPAQVDERGDGFTLIVDGSGFLPGDTARIDGRARATIVASGSSLMVAILAADIAVAGSRALTLARAGQAEAVLATLAVAAVAEIPAPVPPWVPIVVPPITPVPTTNQRTTDTGATRTTDTGATRTIQG